MPLDTGPTSQHSRSAAALLNEMAELRSAVIAEGGETLRGWGRIDRRGFRLSVRNLAEYLALRRRDLRDLQSDLMPWGLSSLGRLESRVRPTLDAVAATLGCLAGRAATPDHGLASARRFFRGERLLRRNTRELFGEVSGGRQVHILTTLAKNAATNPDLVTGLVTRGVTAVRINCAHDGPAVWERMIANVRDAEHAQGRRVRILMDLGGPKIRIGQVVDFGERAMKGQMVLLTAAVMPDAAEYSFQIAVAPEILRCIELGHRISIDDGRLALVASELVAEGLLARVEQGDPAGFRLKPEKGINLPDSNLGLGPLTAKDLSDLDFVAAHADLVGYSFVQNAADIETLQDQLAIRRPVDWRRLGIIAKIETPAAVANLPEIIVAAARRQPFGIMIARGDLAVEIGFERLAEMQEEILWLAEAAQVPVIWATQVLEQMVKKGLPTRGEMTDAAMAGRAECVMLNKGPYVESAVEALDRLLSRMAEHQCKKTSRMRALRAWQPPAGRSAEVTGTGAP